MALKGTIRSATSSDTQALQSLAEISLRTLAGEAFDATTVDAMLRQGSFAVPGAPGTLGSIFVIEIARRIVGWCAWSVPADSGAIPEVHGPFVDPAYARRGIATRLMARLEADCAQLGYAALSARVTLNALPFFQAMGFRPERLLSSGAGGAFLRVAMTKERSAELPAAA